MKSYGRKKENRITRENFNPNSTTLNTFRQLNNYSLNQYSNDIQDRMQQTLMSPPSKSKYNKWYQDKRTVKDKEYY